MKLTFLGTGTSQGVPVIACPCPVCQSDDEHDKRLRSSVLFEDNGVNILIDAGPDFRQQMLRAGVKSIDGILLTHEHKDHIGGLDDVRAFNYVNQRPMDIYAELRVQEALKQEYAYVFAENRYPGIPEMNLLNIDGNPFEISGVTVIPIRCLHYMMPIYGYRIGDITYITDANFISEEEKKKIVGSKYIVVNALRKEKHISHYTLDEALQLIEEFNPHRAFITHVSHQMGFHADILSELPSNVTMAYDGLVVEI